MFERDALLSQLFILFCHVFYLVVFGLLSFVWFVLPQGIANFARRVGRGNSDWETLVFDVGVDGWSAHFSVNINQKGNMVRRKDPVLPPPMSLSTIPRNIPTLLVLKGDRGWKDMLCAPIALGVVGELVVELPAVM